MSQPGITFGESTEWAVDNLVRKAKSPVKNVKRLLRTGYEEKTKETIFQIEEDRTVSKPELPVLPLSGPSTFNSSPMPADNGRSEHQGFDSGEHEISAGLEPEQHITRTEHTRLVNTTLSQILPASLPKTMEKILDKLKRTGLDSVNEDLKMANRDSAPSGRPDKQLVEPVAAHMLTNLYTQVPRQIREKQTNCWRGLKDQVDKYVSPPREKWNKLKNHYIKLKGNSLKHRGITGNGGKDKAEEYISDKTGTDVEDEGQTQGLDNRLRAKAAAFLQLLPKGPFLNRKGHAEITEESLSKPTETHDKITGKGVTAKKDHDFTQIRKPMSLSAQCLKDQLLWRDS
ncbi:hypothetical protein AHF37_00036 [Paragonimus kellicotti]|nr:hypothetical protein AHF37_00036 [Paragonimus kellicotti]